MAMYGMHSVRVSQSRRYLISPNVSQAAVWRQVDLREQTRRLGDGRAIMASESINYIVLCTGRGG